MRIKKIWAAACLGVSRHGSPGAGGGYPPAVFGRRRKLGYDNAEMGVTGWAEELRLRTESFPNLQFISQSIGTLKLGYGFEGEVLFSFSRRFGLGLSGGYSFGSLPEKDASTTSIWDGSPSSTPNPPK